MQHVLAVVQKCFSVSVCVYLYKIAIKIQIAAADRGLHCLYSATDRNLPVFEKTCGSTQKNVKSHFLDFEKKVKYVFSNTEIYVIFATRYITQY